MTALLTHEGTQDRTAEPATPAGRGALRRPWHRIRLAVREMNHASRRVAELAAPWSVDQQWHRR